MKKQTVKRIVSYLKPYAGQMTLSIVSALLYVLFTLFTPIIIGQAIDYIVDIGKVDFNGVLKCLFFIAITVLGAATFQWIMNVSVRKISAYAARDMRNQAFNRLNNVPLKYIDTNSHGDLISRMVNDTDLVCEGILQGLTQFLPGISTILGTLLIMFYYNPYIAMVVVFVTPLSIWFAGFVGKRTATLFRQYVESQGKMSGLINEMVSGANVVKAFCYQEKCYERFDDIAEDMYKYGYLSIFYAAATNPGTRFINAIVYAAVAVIGAITAINGGLTIGQLTCFLTYATQYTKPFNEITGVLTQLQSARAGAERLFVVMDAETQEPDKKNAVVPAECNGHVSVKDVNFSYKKDVPLIRDFSLEAKKGNRIAIVGPTGCGKTTLINLLMRFYDVNGGEISVDGNNVLDMQRDALRSMYGMVLQETWLKNASVKDNIAYGNPEANMEEIISASKSAYAHSFIKRLPQGYDTIILPGGSNLSAGQRQLLCIARIMLCQPDMLILDEATSSIDTRTEVLVQKAFEKLMQGHTTFVVAHRLSTIQSADKILVMKDGCIIEQGKHEELLAQNGFYAELYNSQFVQE